MSEFMKEKIIDGIEDKYLSEAVDSAKNHKMRSTRWLVAMGRMAACMVVIMGVSLVSLSTAVAAGNMAAYDILYAIYPHIAQKLIPVNICCEDAGIRMEVEGVSIQGNRAYIYISMHDLEGKYMDESIDLFDSYSIHTTADQIGECSLVEYDEEMHKATFLITIQQMDDTPIEGSAMTFSVSQFLTGKMEMRGELTQIVGKTIPAITETQKGEKLNIRGGSYTDSGMVQEYLYADEGKMFCPAPGVTVTNYGFVNAKLHVQVYYEDILQFDNHGYIYLLGAGGKEVLPKSSTAFWDAERKGSYEEYVFDISEEELKTYTICGHFFTCQNLVKGDWEVKFTIKEGAEWGTEQ